MSPPRERFFVWCGPAFLALFAAGMLGARWMAPPRASETADQIAAMYRANPDAIRIGILISIVGGTLFAPFASVMSEQLKRIEGGTSIFSNLQLILGGLLVIEFIMPLMILGTAAFRLDRSDNAILLLNDLGWLMFVGFVTTVSLELTVVGVVVLRDRRAQPLFPRWFAWLSFGSAALVGLGIFDLFSISGPFAWNGVLTWWAGVVGFGSWMVVTTVLLLRALSSEDCERSTVPGAEAAELAGLADEVEALRVRLADLSTKSRDEPGTEQAARPQGPECC